MTRNIIAMICIFGFGVSNSTNAEWSITKSLSSWFSEGTLKPAEPYLDAALEKEFDINNISDTELAKLQLLVGIVATKYIRIFKSSGYVGELKKITGKGDHTIENEKMSQDYIDSLDEIFKEIRGPSNMKNISKVLEGVEDLESRIGEKKNELFNKIGMLFFFSSKIFDDFFRTHQPSDLVKYFGKDILILGKANKLFSKITNIH